MKTLRFEVPHGRPDMTDNRLLIFDDAGNLLSSTTGSRTVLQAAFNRALKKHLEPNAVEVFQTHTLPNFVKDYFGTRNVEMKRGADGKSFDFTGPMLAITINKGHAFAARRELVYEIRRKLAASKGQ
jgi:hypothetical protein